jgi:hypothetical protein
MPTQREIGGVFRGAALVFGAKIAKKTASEAVFSHLAPGNGSGGVFYNNFAVFLVRKWAFFICFGCFYGLLLGLLVCFFFAPNTFFFFFFLFVCLVFSVFCIFIVFTIDFFSISGLKYKNLTF